MLFFLRTPTDHLVFYFLHLSLRACTASWIYILINLFVLSYRDRKLLACYRIHDERRIIINNRRRYVYRSRVYYFRVKLTSQRNYWQAVYSDSRTFNIRVYIEHTISAIAASRFFDNYYIFLSIFATFRKNNCIKADNGGGEGPTEKKVRDRSKNIILCYRSAKELLFFFARLNRMRLHSRLRSERVHNTRANKYDILADSAADVLAFWPACVHVHLPFSRNAKSATTEPS